MKIAVSGGLGYIGAHTVVELIQAGYEVVIIDNLSNSEISVLDGIARIVGFRPEFWEQDLCDFQGLRTFFTKDQSIGGIIHFAALKFVAESVHKPLDYYENNLLSLLNLLKMAKEFWIQNFVFSSSCTVYGKVDNPPVSESFPVVAAESPYGNTKQIAEEIIRDFVAAENHSRAISLRYFNPVGAHASGEIGELGLGRPENLMPNLMGAARGEIPFLKVFGNDYNTPDGTAVRDYIHVVDLARAHVAALLSMEERGQNAIRYYNLGAGKGYSVLEMIRAFEGISGRDLPYKIMPRREGDIEKIWANVSLAKEELSWEATLDLKEMIRSHWEWDLKRRTSSGHIT